MVDEKLGLLCDIEHLIIAQRTTDLHLVEQKLRTWGTRFDEAYPASSVALPESKISVLEACVREQLNDVANMLLANGLAQVDVCVGFTCTALCKACYQCGENIGLIKILLFYGSNPNTTISSDGCGVSCLMACVMTNNRDAVELLLEYGAEVGYTWKGQNALSMAVDFRHADIVNLIEQAELSQLRMAVQLRERQQQRAMQQQPAPPPPPPPPPRPASGNPYHDSTPRCVPRPASPAATPSGGSQTAHSPPLADSPGREGQRGSATPCRTDHQAREAGEALVGLGSRGGTPQGLGHQDLRRGLSGGADGSSAAWAQQKSAGGPHSPPPAAAGGGKEGRTAAAPLAAAGSPPSASTTSAISAGALQAKGPPAGGCSSSSSSNASGAHPRRNSRLQVQESGVDFGRTLARQSILTSKFLSEIQAIDWVYGAQDVEVGKCLGAGGFGSVYKSRLKPTGDYVACKVVTCSDEELLKVYKAELMLLSKFRHESIVLFLGAVVDLPQLCILTELMQCNLHTRLTAVPSLEIPWVQRVKWLRDIARAMNYLHSRSPPVVHRDLKSFNILLDEYDKVKLCDFGLSQVKHHSRRSNHFITGSPAWMAPEALRGEDYTLQSDVYSFGVVMWEVLTRRPPWKGKAVPQLVGLVGFSNTHLEMPKPTPSGVPQEYVVLLLSCRAPPSERPSFRSLATELEGLHEDLSVVGDLD